MAIESKVSEKLGITKFALILVIVLILGISGLGVFFANNIIQNGKPSISDYTFNNSISSQGSSNQSFSIPCGGNIWATYHCNYLRDGVDLDESSIHLPALAWNSETLDGDVYAEPLIAFGEVFVVTENDSAYALNVTTGKVMWKTNVGQPVQSGLPCGDISPLGITGTPVLDINTKVLYFVAELSGGDHYLFGVSTVNGSIEFRRIIDPPGSVPIDQQQRTALALYDGIIYVGLGGLDGDCGTYHGWIVGAQLNDSSKLYTFEVASASSDSQGGIWEVGGPSIAPNGDLYIATGNSESAGGQPYDYGDGVIQLSPTLQVISYFAPADYVSLNSGDTDLGSTGPIILGNSSLVFQIGKDGVGYILNQSNLGGINGSLFKAQVCNGGYSADAYYDSVIYVPCNNGLFALKLAGASSQPSFSEIWSTNSFSSGAPIVSGGAVWTINIDNGTLLALNPTSGTRLFSYNLGPVVHFETPASADGMIFAASNDQITAISIST
jgi:outer membrane protein assembly factor BamB